MLLPVFQHSKRHNYLFALSACLGLLMLSLGTLSQAAPPIRFLVGYPQTAHPPYYMETGTETGENPGFAVEVIQRLGERIKEVRLELVRCPLETCLEQLRTGKLDGLFAQPYREQWLFTGKYPFTKAKVDPRQKLFREEYALYRVKDTRISTDGDRIYGLKGQSVITLDQGAVIPLLEEKGYPLITFATTTEALQALLQRQAPAAVLIASHVELLAQQHPELGGMLSRSEYPLMETDYYLMLSRQFYAKKPWLAEKIWEEQTKLLPVMYERLSTKYIQ